MKQTIDYSKHTNMDAKRDVAINDVKEYLGEERFNKATKDFRSRPVVPLAYFQGLCEMLIGIEGYPVQAWYEHIYSTTTKTESKS